MPEQQDGFRRHRAEVLYAECQVTALHLTPFKCSHRSNEVLQTQLTASGKQVPDKAQCCLLSPCSLREESGLGGTRQVMLFSCRVWPQLSGKCTAVHVGHG